MPANLSGTTIAYPNKHAQPHAAKVNRRIRRISTGDRGPKYGLAATGSSAFMAFG